MSAGWVVITHAGMTPSKRTHIWSVSAALDGSALGEIKWFAKWRQYVFAPHAMTVWNPDCMDEVSRFLRRANIEHKGKPGARV